MKNKIAIINSYLTFNKNNSIINFSITINRITKRNYTSTIHSYEPRLISRITVFVIINGINKRFYPGGKPIGHAPRILDLVNKSHVIPILSTTPSISQEKGLPFNQITNQPGNKISYFEKMKHFAMQIIPSVKPKSENIVSSLDLTNVQQKEALANILNYFPQLPNEFVQDPNFIMMFHKVLTEQHPEVQIRAYQLALEMFYNKKRFDQQTVCDIFDNKFSILDLIGRNKNVIDMSTFYSALQVNHMLTQPGFNNHVDTRVVVATCIDSADLKNLSPKLLAEMERIKRATGNTVNDVNLNGHPYGFKITNEPSFARNHIMFIAINDKNSFGNISKDILRPMIQEIIKLENLRNKNIISQKDLHRLHQYEQMVEFIGNIRNSEGNDNEKFYTLNTFLFQNLSTRSPNIYVPIFIPIDSKPFTPHPQLVEDIKKITLPNQKVLQAPHVRQAIMGVTESWDYKTKAKAFINTDGSLGTMEEVD